MENISMTPEDARVVNLIYDELKAAQARARAQGRRLAFLNFLDEDNIPIGNPLRVQPRETTPVEIRIPAALPPQKTFDPDKTIFGDSLNETVTEHNIPALGHQQFSATEQEIIDVLTDADKPLKATQISLRAGKSELTEYFRKKIYALVKKGEIKSLEDNRYWLVRRPLDRDVP